MMANDFAMMVYVNVNLAAKLALTCTNIPALFGKT